MKEEVRKKERIRFTKVLKGEGVDYYVLHLKLLSIFLLSPLTETEITVLAHFMNIDNPIAKEDRFNSIFRRIVYKALNMKPNTVSFHLKSLKDKGVIKEDAIGRLLVWEILWPDNDYSKYEFVIQNTGWKSGV